MIHGRSVVNLRLKMKILEKYETQMEFAKIIGVHAPFLSLIVRGWAELPDDKKEKWAKLLECEKSDIF